jgi:hypothetical protein
MTRVVVRIDRVVLESATLAGQSRHHFAEELAEAVREQVTRAYAARRPAAGSAYRIRVAVPDATANGLARAVVSGMAAAPANHGGQPR